MALEETPQGLRSLGSSISASPKMSETKFDLG
jgi:hypothetical protein